MSAFYLIYQYLVNCTHMESIVYTFRLAQFTFDLGPLNVNVTVLQISNANIYVVNGDRHDKHSYRCAGNGEVPTQSIGRPANRLWFRDQVLLRQGCSCLRVRSLRIVHPQRIGNITEKR